MGSFLLKRKQKLLSKSASEGQAEVGVSPGQTQEDPHSTCSLPEYWDQPRTTDRRAWRHEALFPISPRARVLKRRLLSEVSAVS